MSNQPSSQPRSPNLVPRTLFICGPTASGKSDLAMRIAKEYDGEIICADSQTVRRGMDIGTAKPSKEDQAAVPHHLLDIIDPNDRFSVHQFKDLAEKSIQDIQNRGKLPVIVGGTGLYIDALLYGFTMRPSTSAYSRKELEHMDVSALQKIIRDNGYPMPENLQNPRHLIRVIEAEGVLPQKQPLRYGAIVVGIDPGKEAVEQRIQKRAEVMVHGGLAEELEGLLQAYGEPAQQFDAIEYRIAYENRGADKEELTQKLIIGDRQYAKKQRSWLKRNGDIVWFDTPDAAFEHVRKIFSS